MLLRGGETTRLVGVPISSGTSTDLPVAEVKRVVSGFEWLSTLCNGATVMDRCICVAMKSDIFLIPRTQTLLLRSKPLLIDTACQTEAPPPSSLERTHAHARASTRTRTLSHGHARAHTGARAHVRTHTGARARAPARTHAHACPCQSCVRRSANSHAAHLAETHRESSSRRRFYKN